jgi:predicted GTPase
MASAPSKSSREITAAEMAKWLADNGFTGSKIVKVLVLGNSGAGKSFLCNAIVGRRVVDGFGTVVSHRGGGHADGGVECRRVRGCQPD